MAGDSRAARFGKGDDMKVSDVMTRDVTLIAASDTIRDAARSMAECDAGALPVGENDRLVGVITDRDIAIRAVAEGKTPNTEVREVMTPQVLYCYEDETVEHVAENMGEQQIRRLPVMSREKRLVGIVSIADLSRKTRPNTTGKTVAAISQPGGEHSQSVH
jgi:CBS domain-containing protein